MSVVRDIAARLRSHLHKDTVGWMHDTINPLWNITARQAQMIYDFARSGNYAQLEYLYNEVENSSPVFNVCVTRRCSALSELDWQVVRSDQRLNRNADAALVKEQIECIETAIAKIDNLPEALEHFALSAFRGFSICSVWRGADGMPNHLECLDQWNCCHDLRNDKWLWNPGAISFMNPTLGGANGLAEIPKQDSIVVCRKRQIDWPAMKIFLREAVGERDWGRFLETYGLPPVTLTMPEFTNEEDKQWFVDAAAAIFEGKNGAVPYGTNVNYASDSRGTNPFSEFIDHQMKLFVLLATGGTLTSLSEAQGIGSGASDAQMDVWKQIVRADVRVVSNAINKQLCEPIIKENFRGHPMLAEFKLDTEPPMSAKDIAELASTLSGAGFEMDAEELSQITGFSVRKKDEGGATGFNSAPPAGSTSVASAPGVTIQAEAVDEAAPKPPKTPQNASLVPTGADIPPETPTPQEAANPRPVQTPPEPSLSAAEAADEVTPEAEEIGERLVRSLQTDFKDVANEIAGILAKPESERAGAATELLSRIDALVPDDPAMAEVIADQMREAFQQQLSKQPEGDAPAANKAIPN